MFCLLGAFSLPTEVLWYLASHVLARQCLTNMLWNYIFSELLSGVLFLSHTPLLSGMTHCECTYSMLWVPGRMPELLKTIKNLFLTSVLQNGNFCLDNSLSDFSRSLCRASLSSGVSTAPLNLVSWANLLSIPSGPVSKSFMKML